MRFTGDSKNALIYFFSQKWKALCIIVILSFVVAFFESIATFAVYPVLRLVSSQASDSGQNVYLDAIMSRVIDWGWGDPLYTAIVLLFGLTLIKLVANYATILFSWATANKIYQETQIRMMSSLLVMDYQFLLSTQKGDLAYRVLTAPGYVSKMLNTIPNMVVETLKVIMMVSMLFVIAPRVTMFLIIIAGTYFIIARFVAKRVSYGTGSGRAKSASRQVIHAMNALKGIKAIRLFGVAKYWSGLFGDECKKFYYFAKKDATISSIPSMLLELSVIFFVCVLALYFTTGEKDFLSNVPVMGVFAYSLLKIMPALKQISNYGMEIMANLPHAEAAYHAIGESEAHRAIGESEGHWCNDVGEKHLEEFNNEILINNASFYYADTEKPAVKNVSVDIHNGSFVGVIGPSGSGKTTLLDLLTGLLRVSSGEILIDGKPIGSFSPEYLAKHIGYVGQDPFLFNDTIKNNILFGRDCPGDDVVNQALLKADILEFVEGLPGGLDFVIADDGMKLSGGQRQRISIARALLLNPEILFLDEATSALDHKTEENIVNTILKVVKEENKTVIFVTHRESAVRKADKIIEMRDGRIMSCCDPVVGDGGL